MRTLQMTMAVVALASVLAAAGCGPEGRTEAEAPAPVVAPGKLLILADEWKQLAPLIAVLRAEGGYTVVMSDQKDLPESLLPFQSVIMYQHSAMTLETERALVRYATLGGRLLVLHHGMASARVKNPEWLKMAGIAILPRDDPKTPWRVIAPVTHTLVNLAPGHYITTHGVTYNRKVKYQSPDVPARAGEFQALDLPETEVFLNQQFTDGAAKTVLFGCLCIDPKTGETIMQDRGGWYKPTGKGWLFYLQPGHAESDYRNRSFCQIILNCLVWRPGMEGSPVSR